MSGFEVLRRRTYRMQARRTASDRTRARLIRAARRLLCSPGGIAAFTVEAVARGAAVSRMTVYHQFDSKAGLIEAVFDSLAIVRVGVPRLVAALALRDPFETLSEFVTTFGEVWEEDRPVIRRLQGLAATDPAFARAWRRREERRREGLRAIVTRIATRRTPRARHRDMNLRTDLLYALIAFETYDVAAGPGRPLEKVVPLIHRLAVAALDVAPPAP
jgi:AcrR family transcriptional regulator